MYVCFASMHICPRCGVSAYSGHKRASYLFGTKLKRDCESFIWVLKGLIKRKKMHPQCRQCISAAGQSLNEENSTTGCLYSLQVNTFVSVAAKF